MPYSRHPNGTIISVDYFLPPLTIYNYENTIRWVDDGTLIGVYIFKSTSRDGDYSIIARTNERRYIDSDVISITAQ